MKISLFLITYLISSICQAQEGLWGMTFAGGSNDLGVIFKTDIDGNNFILKKDITSEKLNGGQPRGKLTQALNGKLYGITTEGGSFGYGTIFEFDLSTNELTKKIDFDDQNGRNPYGSLLLASNGKLYGTTRFVGSYKGSIFEYDPDNNLIEIKQYFDGPYSGGLLQANLIQAINGKIYGTTVQGGVYNLGVIFEYDLSSNTLVKLYEFNPTDGASPRASLTELSAGKLYGTTLGGGVNNLGTIFMFDLTDNQYYKLIDFDLDIGFNPMGNLTLASNGKLYGTTQYSSTSPGFLFEFDPSSNQLNNKVGFESINGNSSGDLFLAPNGKLYGATQFGGENDLGALFEYDPITAELNNKFDFDKTNGAIPLGFQFTYIKNRVNQTISFTPIGLKKIDDAPFNLDATSTSMLPVQFRSSSSDKITLNDIEVTVLITGKATVTASQSGNIDFAPADEVAQEFCINPRTPTIAIDNSNLLEPILTSSSEAGNQWYKDGILIPMATNRTLNVLSSGVYSVEVSVEGCMSGKSDNQPLIITAVNEIQDFSMVITPNPATNHLKINLPENGTKEIKLFSLTGAVLHKQESQLGKIELDINFLPEGYYLISVSTMSGKYFGRFIKQ